MIPPVVVSFGDDVVVEAVLVNIIRFQAPKKTKTSVAICNVLIRSTRG